MKVDWGKRVLSVIDMIRSHGRVEKRKGQWNLLPLMDGQTKINVDESFLEWSGKGGIGGSFRDSCNKVLIQFGKEVNVESVVIAKIFIFRDGILIVAASR